jgi:hypothetical protein
MKQNGHITKEDDTTILFGKPLEPGGKGEAVQLHHILYLHQIDAADPAILSRGQSLSAATTYNTCMQDQTCIT